MMIRSSATALLLLAALGTAKASTGLWDLPPLRYSQSEAHDPISQWARKLNAESPNAIPHPPLDRLRMVLKLLDIPEESQILVFSKTSKQNSLIYPSNPRCLFFSENAYVGYVPGGDIEVISHDRVLGPVFHVISTGTRSPTIKRHTSACLSCHGTARTESVPGVLVRSVFPDEQGQPLLAIGSHLTTHSSPIPERWGGYYVTGKSSLPHMGNQTFTENHDPNEVAKPPTFKTLETQIDTRRYLRPTSDIVALMVLEHQCQLQNQLMASATEYRRFQWLRKSINPQANASDETSQQFIDHSAAKIVELLLFSNEARLGPGGIDGDPAFQTAFTKRFPKSSKGRSLADFQLYRRIFKYPCSYMIYSKAFQALPAVLLDATLKQLAEALESPPSTENHPEISASTRRKTLAILRDTVPNWPTN